jgi:predicted transcriptional regulator
MLDAGPLPDGRHLRLLRRFRERTLEETSAQAGISLAKLAKIETGRVTPRTIDIARILAALATDPDREVAQSNDPVVGR